MTPPTMINRHGVFGTVPSFGQPTRVNGVREKLAVKPLHVEEASQGRARRVHPRQVGNRCERPIR